MISVAAVDALKNIYESKKETVEYLCRFGNAMEKAKASFIKEVATGNF
ncbi:hypothetical protein [Methanosarcina sp. UBA289]|nr:hypothetical protein [Methanosarcina sp. UBA289]